MSEQRRIDFVIAGASKCATEWLRYVLHYEDGIYIPLGDTIDYFSENYCRKADWYYSHFTEADESDIVGEKSTSYFQYRAVPRRMWEEIPDVKLIFMLRDPVQRAYSHYCMKLRAGEVSTAIEKEVVEDTVFVEEGLYYRNICRFLEYYNRDAMKVVLVDDIKRDPENVYNDLCAFIGSQGTSVPRMIHDTFHTRRTRPKYEKLYQTVVKIVGGLEDISDTLARVMGRVRTSWVTDLFHRLNRGENYPELSGTLARRLCRIYRPDLQRLETLIDRQVTDWLKSY